MLLNPPISDEETIPRKWFVVSEGNWENEEFAFFPLCYIVTHKQAESAQQWQMMFTVMFNINFIISGGDNLYFTL